MWTRILKAAKANGYDGKDDDLAAVKAFVDSKLEIQDADGNPVDVDAAFKAHNSKAKAKTAVVLEDDEVDPDSVTITKSDLDKLRRKAHKGSGAPGLEPETRSVTLGKVEHKAYNAKATRGEAAFTDADSAETCAAYIRLAICANVPGYAQKANDLAIVKNYSTKAQVEYDNTLGGYTVPPEFVAQLLYMTEPYGTARKLANVRRMSRDVQQYPRKTGIPGMTWVGESQTVTAQNNTYDLVELVAKKMMTLMSASNELLEDSAINIADDIASSVREAYDISVDQAYFNGDGTATYGGFTGLKNALPAGAYINGSGGTWASLTTADHNKLIGSVENVSPGRLAFVGSRQYYHQVCMRLEKAPSQFKGLIEGPAADGSFLGFPFYFSQVLPTSTAATQKSVYFGDFVGASMIGERRDLTIMASEHSAFANDMIQYRATARASINIHGDGRGSTIGPIVALVTT